MASHGTKATLLAGLALSLLACKDDAGGFDFATMGMGSAAGNDDGTAGDGTASGGTQTAGSDDATDEGMATSASDGSGTAADSTGGSESGGDDGLPVEPCIGMDILFVVDNSSTMIEEQVRLASNAAAWLSTVNASTPTAVNNVNVGVITTDESAMVTATAADCGFASGLSYMQMAGADFDPVAFAAEVQCALSVGVDGSSDERPMEHLLEALSPSYVDAGGPNAGFLRNGALLVVVLLTDEEDDLEAATAWGSAGDPASWITDVAALKGGIPKDVVVLSFIGMDKPNECPAFQWDGMTGAELSPRLEAFTAGFPAGAVQDICAADYSTFLDAVVPGIAGSCTNFSPP